MRLFFHKNDKTELIALNLVAARFLLPSIIVEDIVQLDNIAKNVVERFFNFLQTWRQCALVSLCRALKRCKAVVLRKIM
jgi:hypothetical protein